MFMLKPWDELWNVAVEQYGYVTMLNAQAGATMTVFNVRVGQTRRGPPAPKGGRA
jgi:hypothetical protein